jgi:hypothetical protein
MNKWLDLSPRFRLMKESYYFYCSAGNLTRPDRLIQNFQLA